MFIGLFGLSPVQRRRQQKSLTLGEKVGMFLRFWLHRKVFIVAFCENCFLIFHQIRVFIVGKILFFRDLRSIWQEMAI